MTFREIVPETNAVNMEVQGDEIVLKMKSALADDQTVSIPMAYVRQLISELEMAVEEWERS